jgi:hypothetical protein
MLKDTCKFSGFHSGAAKVFALLGYFTLSLRNWCPAFKDTVLSYVKMLKSPVKMCPVCFLESSGTNHPVTRKHIPGE